MVFLMIGCQQLPLSDWKPQFWLRSGREDKTDGVGTRFHGGERVEAVGGAANLYPIHDFSAPSPV